MAEDDTDKQHAASGKQREKFAAEGDIARSRDLSAALLVAVCMVVLTSFGTRFAIRLAVTMQQAMRNIAQPVDQNLFRHSLSLFWLTTGPFFAVSIVLAVGIAYWQNGWSLQFRPLKFNLSGLTNFVPRLLQLFAFKQSGANLLVQAVKMVVLGWVCMSVLVDKVPPMVQRVPASVQSGLSLGADLIGTMLRRALLAYILIGIVDYLINWWRAEQRMKMSTQELRDEAKDAQGDGRVKGRMRAMHQKLVQQRSLQEVPKADVVLVNPTHYAVAVAYDDAAMEAPQVLAKGTDLWAERIRSIARSHGVPVISQPALARALYREVQPGAQIPQQLYQAVALVLAHVYRIRRRDN